MALKDYRYTITGSSIQIASDLVLNEPELRINSVYYKVQEPKADIELLIREGQGAFFHSRSYTIDTPLEQEGWMQPLWIMQFKVYSLTQCARIVNFTYL